MNKSGKKTNTCKLFSLDLMHLSTREFEEIKDLEGLKAHLKGCKKCQKELKDLQMVDLFSFLAGPRSEKFKKGMAELSERIKKETSGTPCEVETSGHHCEIPPELMPKGKLVSVEELFSGHTGTVRKTVDKEGIINLEDLPDKSKLPPEVAYGAMVLLAQKKGLCFVEHEDHVDVFVPK